MIPICLGRYVYILGNTKLKTLEGMETLEKIEGYLHLEKNLQLVHVDALSSSLRTVGRNIVVRGNSALQNIAGLHNLQRIGGSAEISEQPNIGCVFFHQLPHGETASKWLVKKLYGTICLAQRSYQASET